MYKSILALSFLLVFTSITNGQTTEDSMDLLYLKAKETVGVTKAGYLDNLWEFISGETVKKIKQKQPKKEKEKEHKDPFADKKEMKSAWIYAGQRKGAKGESAVTKPLCFDVVLDALRRSPKDWSNKDYRNAKQVYTNQYFRKHFAVKAKLGRRAFGSNKEVKPLGQLYDDQNVDKLKNDLAQYMKPSESHCTRDPFDVFKNVKQSIADGRRQSAIIKLEYKSNNNNREQKFLIYKTEKCYAKDVCGGSKRAAVALYLIDLDPQLEEKLVTDADVKAACHRLFFFPRAGKYALEKSYVDKYQQAYAKVDGS